MDRIDALRIFVEVVGAGSFSAVARQRNVVASTVTAAIGQLEREAGTQLMARSTRRLVLTHEGGILLGDARRIVAEWDAAMSGLRQDGPLEGPVRVTATNDFGRTQLRPLLDAFQARHPAIHITLLLSDNTVDLIDGRIDLALRSGPLPDSGLRARLLIRGRRLVCAAPSYWARHGRPAHPDELAAHNCLVLAWLSDDGVDHAAIDAQRRARGGRGLRRTHVEDHVRHFVHGGGAAQDRRTAVRVDEVRRHLLQAGAGAGHVGLQHVGHAFR